VGNSFKNLQDVQAITLNSTNTKYFKSPLKTIITPKAPCSLKFFPYQPNNHPVSRIAVDFFQPHRARMAKGGGHGWPCWKKSTAILETPGRRKKELQ
jgi:hypothetical protein